MFSDTVTAVILIVPASGQNTKQTGASDFANDAGKISHGRIVRSIEKTQVKKSPLVSYSIPIEAFVMPDVIIFEFISAAAPMPIRSVCLFGLP